MLSLFLCRKFLGVCSPKKKKKKNKKTKRAGGGGGGGGGWGWGTSRKEEWGKVCFKNFKKKKKN